MIFFCVNNSELAEKRLSVRIPAVSYGAARPSLPFCFRKEGMEMILSYQDIFQEGAKRIRIKATITTEHSASSYGQPVIVLDDGGALDLMSWVAMDYHSSNTCNI